MNNKKILQQILKIDTKADLVHHHDEYLALDAIPSGGYMSIDIKSSDWNLTSEGLYSTDIRHQLATNSLIVEAVSSEGSLLVIGYDAKGDNEIELMSEEAIDMTVTIIHRTEAHTVVGYNPIDDSKVNNYQTWSSEKISQEINNRTNGITIMKITQEEYDNLDVKDSNTLYIVIE